MNCTKHPDVEAAGFCSYCGKPFCKECLIEVKGRMYCKDDLGNVLDEARQTPSSSTPVINISNSNQNSNVNAGGFAPPVARKSKSTALILCLLGFIGIGGLHRMYVGKAGSGLFHLLTGGVCVIGTIVDLLAIVSGGFRDSYGYPLV